MSKRRPEVVQTECSECGYVFNSVEDPKCPQCIEMKEIYTDLFGDTDDDTEIINPIT